MNFGLYFALADHSLVLVRTNSSYVQAFTVDVVIVQPGQLVDVLITTNHTFGKFYMAGIPFSLAPYSTVSNISFVQPNNTHMSLLELAYLFEHGLNVLNSSLDLTFPDQPLNPFNYIGNSSNLNPAPGSGTKLNVKCLGDLFLPIIWTLNILRCFAWPWCQQRTLCANNKNVAQLLEWPLS